MYFVVWYNLITEKTITLNGELYEKKKGKLLGIAF